MRVHFFVLCRENLRRVANPQSIRALDQILFANTLTSLSHSSHHHQPNNPFLSHANTPAASLPMSSPGTHQQRTRFESMDESDASSSRLLGAASPGASAFSSRSRSESVANLKLQSPTPRSSHHNSHVLTTAPSTPHLPLSVTTPAPFGSPIVPPLRLASALSLTMPPLSSGAVVAGMTARTAAFPSSRSSSRALNLVPTLGALESLWPRPEMVMQQQPSAALAGKIFLILYIASKGCVLHACILNLDR